MTARRQKTIYLGDVEASREPLVLKTLLGSCIAACLYDPVARVGGMNHFMLPEPSALATGDPARFGVHAMDLLIGALQRLGGERSRLQAKLFGGGHVLLEQRILQSVPTRNIEFIRRFVLAEGLRVLGQDLGGKSGRQVHFCTDTGQAFVKKLAESAVCAPLLRKKAEPPKPVYGEIELFE